MQSEMSKILILALAATATYAISHLFAATLSVTSIAVFVISTYFLLNCLWSIFLRPLYFSELLDLPQAPAKGWQQFLKMYNAKEMLELIDTIPNDGFIRYLDILNTETITITEPRLIAEMLGPKADHLMKRPKIKKLLQSLIGNGLVVAEGKEHKFQRKNLLPAFNHKVIKTLYPIFWSKATEMTTLMKEQIRKQSPEASSGTIDVDDWAGRVSLDIIGKAGFGSEFHSLSQPHTSLNTAYRAAFIPNASSQRLFIWGLILHPSIIVLLPLEASMMLRRGVEAVTKWITDFLARRQSIISEKVRDNELQVVHTDIISVAMESGAFTVENLVDQSKTLLGAGHETSATALTWGIYLLSQPRYANIQERLRQEIRNNLPSPSSGITVTEDMLEKLPYLDAVSKEILRFYAPVPAMGRIVRSPVKIGGKVFPKGTQIMLFPWAVNQCKKLWGEDAREFKPERWLKDKVTGGATDQSAFLTFSVGARNCIGRGFAIGENKALLAQLIGSFDIKPPHGKTEELNVSWGVTARMVGGLPMKVSNLDGW